MSGLQQGRLAFAAGAVVAVLGLAGSASAEFATSVTQFNQGTVAFAGPGVTYNTANTAVGQPSRIAGATTYPGPLSPFNPPYEESEMVAVGVGGSLTLQLPSAVSVQAGSLQVGVFTGAGLKDPTFSGVAESTARTFAGAEYGADRTAIVEVASTLGDFKSLGRVVFTAPTQSFSNQSTPYDFPTSPIQSDFNKPFASTLASFNGLNSTQISTLLDGSAGGTWLSISPDIAAELSSIQYVRISDPKWLVHSDNSLVDARISADNPLGNGQEFSKPADVFIDGVNVVPEPAGLLLAGFGMLALARRRRA